MWIVKIINKILFWFNKKEEKQIGVIPIIPKEKEVPMRQHIVCIDPGHGGKDSGAVTENSKEKELNMIFSNKLFNLLENNYHFVPISVRDRDEYRNLKYRVDFAKEEGADIFISIHANSSVLPKPNDVQIYYYSEEKDKPLAEILFDYVDKIDHDTSRWSREIKANFYVLRNFANTSISAVLIEIGFLSNFEDEILLNDPEFQDKFCEGLYQGIEHYFNVGKE